LTQQSDTEPPQSVGCCVVDDSYGVANKSGIKESAHGCNGSDHDSDDHDSVTVTGKSDSQQSN